MPRTARGAGGAAPGSHSTGTPRARKARTGSSRAERGHSREHQRAPSRAQPRHSFCSTKSRSHPAREEEEEEKEEDPREQGAVPRSAPRLCPGALRARRGPAARGDPRPGRRDRGGGHGKLGGREAGPAGRQRRPMGSAEHDVTALITAWLWLTKRTMSLPSSPLPPWKKSPPTPGPQPPGHGALGAAGRRQGWAARPHKGKTARRSRSLPGDSCRDPCGQQLPSFSLYSLKSSALGLFNFIFPGESLVYSVRPGDKAHSRHTHPAGAGASLCDRWARGAPGPPAELRPPPTSGIMTIDIGFIGRICKRSLR